MGTEGFTDHVTQIRAYYAGTENRLWLLEGVGSDGRVTQLMTAHRSLADAMKTIPSYVAALRNEGIIVFEDRGHVTVDVQGLDYPVKAKATA